MIKRDKRMNPGVVGTIITNMFEVIHDSSTKGGLMPGLQERAREDLSNNNEIDSYDDDGIYEDRELWRYKALTLKQIIGGIPGGMFPHNIPTLYAFSWHGFATFGLTTTKIKLWRTKSHRFSACMVQDHLLGSYKTWSMYLL